MDADRRRPHAASCPIDCMGCVCTSDHTVCVCVNACEFVCVRVCVFVCISVCGCVHTFVLICRNVRALLVQYVAHTHTQDQVWCRAQLHRDAIKARILSPASRGSLAINITIANPPLYVLQALKICIKYAG